MTKRGHKIKVCGMREATNIAALLELPIDYIGFIFYERSPRHVTEVVDVPFVGKPAKKVGVFVNAGETYLYEQIVRHHLHVVQLHGDEDPEFCGALRQFGVEVWKAFGVDDQFDFSTAYDYEDTVDRFVFDTKTALRGGSGQAFDWQVLKNYEGNTPYFISGGLSVDNVLSAAEFDGKGFYGLDLNSKFEVRPGVKDIGLIRNALKKIDDEQISG